MGYVLRDREFTKVVTNHLRLDFDLVELLTGVDTDDGADHLGDNDHVTEVSLDELGLLVGLSLLLGLAELLDQAHRLALETAVEPSAGTGVHDITELFGGEVEELVEIDTAVGKLAELSSLLDLCPNLVSAHIQDIRCSSGYNAAAIAGGLRVGVSSPQ